MWNTVHVQWIQINQCVTSLCCCTYSNHRRLSMVTVCVCGCVQGCTLFCCECVFRHQGVEPSIYQLQLGAAPSLFPEGAARHTLVRSTPLSQRSEVENPHWAAALEQEAGRTPTAAATAYQYVKLKQLFNTNYKDVSPGAKTVRTRVPSPIPLKYAHLLLATKCCFNKQWLHFGYSLINI